MQIKNLHIKNISIIAVSPAPTYRYYRFQITAVRTPNVDGFGSDITQLSEVEIQYRGIRVDYSLATASSQGGGNPPNETPPKAIDNNTGTKWLEFNKDNAILTIDFGQATQADSFRWATANDVPGRDPIQWVLSGSYDNSSYTNLHVQNTDYATPTDRLTWTEVFRFIQ